MPLFQGYVCNSFWDGINLPSILTFLKKTDWWNQWFAHLWEVCTFHVKIEHLHIWRRHVCTIVVDVFLKICTFEGNMFAQMWLFGHLRFFAHFTAPQPARLHTITNWRNEWWTNGKSLNTHKLPDELILGGTIDRFTNIFRFYALLSNRPSNQRACLTFADMATAN